jgi:hypothetical protein
MITPVKFQQNWFDLFPPSLRLLPTELFTQLSIVTISHPFAITFEDRLFYKFLVLSSLLKTWRRACILIENDDICKLGLCFQSQESIFKHLIYTMVWKWGVSWTEEYQKFFSRELSNLGNISGIVHAWIGCPNRWICSKVPGQTIQGWGSTVHPTKLIQTHHHSHLAFQW